MDISVYPIENLTNEQIGIFIDQKKSFVIENIARTNMGEAIKTVEGLIESKGLKCRVYMKGRSATVAAAAIPASPTVIGGWAAAIGIGVHNLLTWDPDYEIAKNPATGTLSIIYKK